MNESLMYEQAFEVLNFLGKDYINKIPEELYKHIENSRMIEKNNVLDFSKHTWQQKISKEAIEFIALLDLEYWATKEEKEELIKAYKENERKYQIECRKKYSPENIFNNRKFNEETTAIIEIKEKKWYENIISLIKKIFRIKK